MSTAVALDAAVSLTAATAKTVVQIVPGTKACRVVEVGVSFDSVTATDAPVVVDLIRQSTAGTSSALTLLAEQENDAVAVVATARKTVTAEPTAVGTPIRTWHVTPIGGTFVIQFPLGREIVASTNRLGLRCTAPQNQTVTAYLSIDE